MTTRLLTRVGEDASNPVYYDASEALTALNQAQRLFAFLTLCLETTGSMSLTAGTAWYTMLDTFSDWLLPLRIRVTGGGKVLPARVQELNALSTTWQAAAGTPERYCALGFELMAIYKQPGSGGTSLDVTYARSPAVMTSASTPEAPEEAHAALIDGAIPLMRAKEGAQELGKSLPFFDRFLQECQKHANFVRARNLAQRYDRQPFELQRFDKSKLIALAMKPAKPAALAIPQTERETNGR
jgi:hypothetical protein